MTSRTACSSSRKLTLVTPSGIAAFLRGLVGSENVEVIAESITLLKKRYGQSDSRGRVACRALIDMLSDFGEEEFLAAVPAHQHLVLMIHDPHVSSGMAVFPPDAGRMPTDGMNAGSVTSPVSAPMSAGRGRAGVFGSDGRTST